MCTVSQPDRLPRSRTRQCKSATAGGSAWRTVARRPGLKILPPYGPAFDPSRGRSYLHSAMLLRDRSGDGQITFRIDFGNSDVPMPEHHSGGFNPVFAPDARGIGVA